jgi:uncharacterized protein (DUF3084 family)
MEEQLDVREKRLDGREKELDGREKELDGREEGLDARDKELDRREKGLDVRDKELDKREKELDVREKEVDVRENGLGIRERELEKKEVRWKELEGAMNAFEAAKKKVDDNVANAEKYVDFVLNTFKGCKFCFILIINNILSDLLLECVLEVIYSPWNIKR